MKRLRLGYSDFWPGFDPSSFVLTDVLRRRFDVTLSAEPEVLVYSVFGTRFAGYRCRRIFYTGENVRPDFAACDFALTFDRLDDPRHFRFPLWTYWPGPEALRNDRQEVPTSALLAGKSKFCAFVVSNPACSIRNRFFKRLSKYKRVDSGGRFTNNVGGPVSDVRSFYQPYKFVIAFENESYPGYTTEKLAVAMAAGAVPIYWGDPTVGLDFDVRSFIRVRDRADIEAAVERVIAADRDDELYADYLRAPRLVGNVAPRCADLEVLADVMERAIASTAPLAGGAWCRSSHAHFRARLRAIGRGLHHRAANRWEKAVMRFEALERLDSLARDQLDRVTGHAGCGTRNSTGDVR